MDSSWFRGPIVRPRIGVLYRAGLAAVAVAMVLLPLLYLALVLAAAGGTASTLYSIATDEDMGLKTRLYGFVFFAAVGGTVVFFLFKPLFAPKDRGGDGSRVLVPAEQARLFAFVAELCAVVGAPRPSRIQVMCDANASASLRRGLWSIGRKDLVLTIGLPLVRDLGLRGFAGVLAHEFGHFAQGSGMGLTYIVRSVNGWFARVVYERDAWDVWLLRWSEERGDFRLTIVGGIARFCVGLVRMVLKLLMWTGHGISSFALRQMEYDADRSEVLVSGADAFEETSRRMLYLGVAGQVTWNALRESLQEGKLVDNIPALTQASLGRLSDSDLAEILAAEMGEKTGIFATHPATRDRIRAAHALGGEGVLEVDAPATDLFDDFDSLCRSTTEAEYKSIIGGGRGGVERVSVEEFVRGWKSAERAYDAFKKEFGEDYHPGAAMFPTPDAPASNGDLTRIQARLAECASKTSSARAPAADALRRFEEQLAHMSEIHSAMATARAGGKPSLDGLAASVDDLPAALEAGQAELEQARSALSACFAPIRERMEIAMACVAREDLPGMEDRPARAEETARVDAALRVLKEAWPAVEGLPSGATRVHAVGSLLQERGASQRATRAFHDEVDALNRHVTQLRISLKEKPNPFVAGADMDALIPALRRRAEAGDVLEASRMGSDSLEHIYGRCLLSVIDLTQEVARALAR